MQGIEVKNGRFHIGTFSKAPNFLSAVQLLSRILIAASSWSFNECHAPENQAPSDEGRMAQILLLLSRLTQFDVPHENLSSLKTTKTLFKYICFTDNPTSRAARILLRLSK